MIALNLSDANTVTLFDKMTRSGEDTALNESQGVHLLRPENTMVR